MIYIGIILTLILTVLLNIDHNISEGLNGLSRQINERNRK